MDERRAIFEHFVQHRRDDLKAEKKAKLTAAKQTFAALLREQLAQQLADSAWSAKMSLSVFLSTLEHALDAARLQHIKESAMALLPTSVQEKLFEKAVRPCDCCCYYEACAMALRSRCELTTSCVLCIATSLSGASVDGRSERASEQDRSRGDRAHSVCPCAVHDSSTSKRLM